MRLEQMLKDQGRLDQSKSLSLRTPPVDRRPTGADCRGISLRPVFPAWFVCEQVEKCRIRQTTARRRRLVRWQDLDARGGRRKFIFDDWQKIRRNADPLRLRLRKGTSAGHRLEMGRPSQPGLPRTDVGRGEGHKRRSRRHQHRLRLRKPAVAAGPSFSRGAWAIAAASGRGCSTAIRTAATENLKLLTRTATNTYFPQVYTVISLPTAEDELMRLVEGLSGELGNVQSVQDVAAAKRFNPKFAAALGTLCGRGNFCTAAAHSRRSDRGRRTVTEDFRVRRLRERTARDRAKSSDREALCADAATRRLGRSGCRVSTSP